MYSDTFRHSEVTLPSISPMMHQAQTWCTRRIDDRTEDGLCHQWPAVMMRDPQDGSGSVWSTSTGSVRHRVDRVSHRSEWKVSVCFSGVSGPSPVRSRVHRHSSGTWIQRFVNGGCQDPTRSLQLSREPQQSEKNGSRQGIAIFIFSNNNNLYDNDYSVM